MPPRVPPRIANRELAAWSAFVGAHAAVIRTIERRLRSEGLPPLGWYDVLWPLSRSPEKRLRMYELADEVVLTRTGLVRVVDRIERAGLVRREPAPEDGRGAYAEITPEGEAVVRAIWPVYGRAISELFVAPAGDDLGHVASALKRVADAAG
jgi:DNA-binding MarR family transcriptional regulator